ncbi:unnamed protein product [Callosobruchus maculatus]|uniref:J domain-containing protein n=1 Tax=Callosobruchus maculatus TaxID=64391 RepID=A0A653CKP7_CALMS|nr:unnamed protein product [Callosobruchus maculatus]
MYVKQKSKETKNDLSSVVRPSIQIFNKLQKCHNNKSYISISSILKISVMYHVTILQFHTAKLLRAFSTSKCLWNHYDVLKLQRKCTAKEIKDSFIRLSKEFHPDINKRDDAHKKFLQINEAYKVLSNTESRRNYDLSLGSMHEVSSGGPYRMYKYNAEPFFHELGFKNFKL